MPTTMIRTEDIGKTYVTTSGNVVALEGVTLEIHQGEITSLLGASGCGKSTFLNVLAGLIPQSNGHAEVGGQPPRPRQQVGMMFQRSLLFPWRTVLENVLLPGEIMKLGGDMKKRAAELLELVGLDGWEDKYPWELSGGMQQRVALCRLLVSNPSLMLLDEPFGALDEFTREHLNLELSRIAHQQRKTALFVTHNIGEAVFLSDRVAVMGTRPGRVLEIVDVDLPRPRTLSLRGSPGFGSIESRIRRVLGLI